MGSKGDWILVDSLQFVDNLFASLATDAPLPETSCRLFTTSVGKLRQYAGCSHGIYLNGNIMFGATGEPVTAEIDHLYIDPSVDRFLLRALWARHGGRSIAPDGDLPSSVRLSCSESVQAAGWEARLGDLLGNCPRHSPVVHEVSRWAGLFDLLDGQRARDAAQRGNHHPQLIERSTDKVLVLTLGDPSKRFPCSQLGTVVLWGNSEESLEDITAVRGDGA